MPMLKRVLYNVVHEVENAEFITIINSFIGHGIFSYSGPSGIFDSDGKQNTAPELGGVRIVALSISSHEQTQYNRAAVFLYCMFSISEGSVLQLI